VFLLRIVCTVDHPRTISFFLVVVIAFLLPLLLLVLATKEHVVPKARTARGILVVVIVIVIVIVVVVVVVTIRIMIRAHTVPAAIILAILPTVRTQ